jgi:hypothetical protein
MHEDTIPIRGFPRGALLKRMGAGGKVTYWRHLLSDTVNMYVMEVKPGACPKNALPYQRWPIKTHLGLLGTVIQQIEESVCPMKMLDQDFQDDEKVAISLKWNMIAWIVADGGDSLVTNESIRSSYVKLAAESAKVKEPYIRSLLTRHYYYAENKYALMAMNHLKGAPGRSRFNITKQKMGRPNDNVILKPNTKFTGKNMTPYYLNRWTDVLMDEYVMGNKNVSEAYEILVRKLKGHNRGPDGNVVSFPVAPEKLPERALFLAYGADIIREQELKKKKLGSLEWNTSVSAQRGHAEDLADGVIEIYDLDGMEFNIELLFGDKPVGKPLVMLAVSRRSRAVVGWYCGLGNENGYAYKHCLFNAFTSKEDRLERFGVSHLTGFVYGVCDWAMFDRGPGISISASKVITKQLRIDAVMTSPRDAKGKAVVENVNGIFQNLLSELPGGFKRTVHVRDKDKHKGAPVDAALDFDQFMKLLLCAISDFNLHTDVSHLMTEAMLKEKNFRPCPKRVFMWHRMSRRGDAAYDWPAQAIYKNLLNRHELLAARGIVTLGKAHYRSDELSTYYDQWNSGPSNQLKSPVVVVYSFAETDEILAWERSDGTLSILEMMKRDKQTYAGAPQWLHTLINRLKNAMAREQRATKKRTAALPAAKEQIIRETDGVMPARVDKSSKRENRKIADANLTDIDHADNLKLLTGQVRGGDTKQAAPIDQRLVGYGKPNADSEFSDIDW